MGQLFACLGGVSCTGANSPEQHEHTIRVVVMGNKGVGKTTLVETYLASQNALHANKDSDANFMSHNYSYMQRDNEENTHIIDMTIVDCKGDTTTASKMVREAQMESANIIFLLYDIGNEELADPIKLRKFQSDWQKELNQAFEDVRPNSHDTQLVLLGVNKHTRELENQETLLSGRKDDEKNLTLLGNKHKRKSMSRKNAEDLLLNTTSLRGSTKKVKNIEIDRVNERKEINQVFNNVIQDYVMMNIN